MGDPHFWKFLNHHHPPKLEPFEDLVVNPGCFFPFPSPTPSTPATVGLELSPPLSAQLVAAYPLCFPVSAIVFLGSSAVHPISIASKVGKRRADMPSSDLSSSHTKETKILQNKDTMPIRIFNIPFETIHTLGMQDPQVSLPSRPQDMFRSCQSFPLGQSNRLHCQCDL